MDDAAHVGSHGVDGSVRAEAVRVNMQVGGTLIDHVTKNVHLHLENERNA